MAEETETPRGKGRDPIMMIGTIVLALAFVVVISGYAYGQVAPEKGGPAKYGEEVRVNYVGSFYGFYDEGGIVFDTSFWDIANDETIPKSFEFKKKDENQYTPFDVTIGSGGALKEFENILIGMSPGDSVRIIIKDGYGTVPESKKDSWKNEDSRFKNWDITERMRVSEFKATFGLEGTVNPKYNDLKHPYGWEC